MQPTGCHFLSFLKDAKAVYFVLYFDAIIVVWPGWADSVKTQTRPSKRASFAFNQVIL